MIAEPTSLRVFIAASGTGGHLLPALHIARALEEKAPGVVIEFIGSGRPLETQLVDAAGFRRHVVTIGGLKRLGLRGFLDWARRLPGAIIEVWRLFSAFKPDVVVGVGGYVSFLPVMIATARFIPTWIHEAERVPGWANFVLSFYATRVSTAFEDAKLPSMARKVHTGAPMRRELFTTDFGKSAIGSPPRVLVLGGSQGAHALDMAMLSVLSLLAERGAEVIHQSRPENAGRLVDAYQEAGVEAKALSFIEKIEEAFQWSDVVVSRSGAGAVREIDVTGRPAILVPLPEAGEQRHNASLLERKGQGVVVEEGEGFEARFRGALEKMLTPEYYAEFNRAEGGVAASDAAGKIAEGLIALGRSSSASGTPGTSGASGSSESSGGRTRAAGS